MKYFLIAGEASGDLHGSNLIKGLVAEDPQAEFRFWGGDMMLQAATAVNGRCPTALLHHYKEGAVMGLTDVLGKAGQLLKNIGRCKDDILAWKPDAVILIDYPGFNFKIAQWAHRHSFKVFYYIAPKTWASRQKRNRKLKKYIDRLFIIFPFERAYFLKQGIPFIYRGNPLMDVLSPREDTELRQKGAYIALLPGSRKGEISRMMPVCMELADTIGRDIVIAGAPARSEADYLPYIAGRKNVRLEFGRTYDILSGADAAIINSGTASLEAAIIGTPQVVCWSTSRLTMFVIRHLLHVEKRIRFISLGNLIVDRLVFKELIQEDFNPETLGAELRRLTDDSLYRGKMLSGYDDIRKALGGKGASRSIAAEMVREMKDTASSGGTVSC